MWTNWIFENKLTWAGGPGYEPIFRCGTPVVLTAEEFDVFISGNEKELVKALEANDDFNQWFHQAGYQAYEPPKAVDIDDFIDAVIEEDGPNGKETEKTIAAFRGMLDCFPNLFPEFSGKYGVKKIGSF